MIALCTVLGEPLVVVMTSTTAHGIRLSSTTSPDPVCPEGNQMPVNLRHRNFLKELDFTGRLHTIKAVMVATLGR